MDLASFAFVFQEKQIKGKETQLSLLFSRLAPASFESLRSKVLYLCFVVWSLRPLMQVRPPLVPV